MAEELAKAETEARTSVGHEKGHPVAELEVDGSRNFRGQFGGKGRLTLFLNEAAKAKIALDYRSPDNLLLSVDSTAGIRLSADDSLTLSGGLSRDLINQEMGGKVGVKLKIARDLAAEFEQEFGASGPKTSVSVTLRL